MHWFISLEIETLRAHSHFRKCIYWHKIKITLNEMVKFVSFATLLKTDWYFATFIAKFDLKETQRKKKTKQNDKINALMKIYFLCIANSIVRPISTRHEIESFIFSNFLQFPHNLIANFTDLSFIKTEINSNTHLKLIFFRQKIQFWKFPKEKYRNCIL